LLEVVTKRARALQRYLREQKVNLPNPIEAVLIAADPGAQIDSVRPITRVVRSDAIKQFANSLSQAAPIWAASFIHDLSDRLVDPRPPVDLKPVRPPSVEAGKQPASRAKAIFDASEKAVPLNVNDLGFEIEEDGLQPAQQDLREPKPARPLPSPNPAAGRKKYFGLSTMQLVILAGMIVLWFCILIGSGAIIIFTQ
jgi:hypothetical protein